MAKEEQRFGCPFSPASQKLSKSITLTLRSSCYKPIIKVSLCFFAVLMHHILVEQWSTLLNSGIDCRCWFASSTEGECIFLAVLMRMHISVRSKSVSHMWEDEDWKRGPMRPLIFSSVSSRKRLSLHSRPLRRIMIETL